ncbi:ribokinase [Leadbetterella byssophila DSM 17132]|uniref:Ribokinase n=1 Tax=Leadbetterella byssophila (strain DSM 17132 / JCM 16389 / KACC 11308 / NBRC 106382 / 4M15) TaxID=649349 RepID=E4RW06_LEAB4|nr:ribokinase [Leadbetterella byssophila DSM 17132]
MQNVSKSKIVVVGSSNTDMVIKASRLPVPGETVIGGEFMMNPGGKGANQAVAVARMGGQVTFITKTGNDLFGRQSMELYNSENINTDYVFSDEDHPSGVALISVDVYGENCILVAPGANAALTTADIEKARKEIEEAEILLMQLEIPMETVEYAAKIAAEKGVKVALNPAPAQTLSNELLKCLYIITPNKNEAEILSGIKVRDWDSAQKSADRISEKGVDIVVVTLGGLGALIKEGSSYYRVEAEKVEAMDTTAAGDTFCGTLCVGLSEGMSIEEAVRMACKASAITVTRMGAQASLPYRHELT